MFKIQLVLVLNHLLPLLILEVDVLVSLGRKQVVLGVVLRENTLLVSGVKVPGLGFEVRWFGEID